MFFLREDVVTKKIRCSYRLKKNRQVQQTKSGNINRQNKNFFLYHTTTTISHTTINHI